MEHYDNIHHQKLVLAEYTRMGSIIHPMTRSHVHDSYELYLLLEGERYYFIHDKTYKVKKGTLVLIPPNRIHKTISTESPDHERLLININGSLLKDFVAGFEPEEWFKAFDIECPVIELDVTQFSLLREKMLHVYVELKENRTNSLNKAMIGVLDILMFLSDIKVKNEHSDLLMDNPTAIRVNEMVQYINDHFQESLTLTTLAKKFYFSPSYLSRCFKNSTGFTLNAYINQVRLLESEKLLSHTTLTIADIAKRTGFSGQTHFGRQFKKYKGITPSVYRNHTSLS